MTNSIETSESEALPWAPRGAAATTPAQPALETDAAPVVDKFKGDDAHLVRCIQALLNFDARGALVPHGLGGHARDLLAAAACRLPLVSNRSMKPAAVSAGVLVPLKPTPEMLRAFDSNLDGLDDDGATRQWGKLMAIAALAQPAPVQPCELCDGTRVVDDGEITHHECGIPYENGPVKCVKDCPACGGDSRAATVQAGPQLTGGRMLVPVEPTPAMLYALWQHRDAMRGTSENKIARESYRAMLAAAPVQQDAHQAATDEAILALNAGERFFSESSSKYPEAGFGTQYHAGKPGVLEFARAVLALAAPIDTSSSSNAATEAL